MGVLSFIENLISIKELHLHFDKILFQAKQKPAIIFCTGFAVLIFSSWSLLNIMPPLKELITLLGLIIIILSVGFKLSKK
ncbi:Uncharacterised protein [uncultured archaeon]|nr:Uncharacterised protein [uncultured archaeon]